METIEFRHGNSIYWITTDYAEFRNITGITVFISLYQPNAYFKGVHLANEDGTPILFENREIATNAAIEQIQAN
jgi:hypothetical protein